MKDGGRLNAEVMADYLVRRLKKRGADDVVVSVNSESVSQLKFANSAVSTTQDWYYDKAEVFLAVGKRLVSTGIRDFSKSAVDDSLRRIMKFVKAAPRNSEYCGIAEGPFTYARISETYDRTIAELGEAAVDLLKGSLDAAQRYGAKRCAGVFETSVSRTYLLTSNEVEAEDNATKAYFSIRAFADKEASGHQVCNSRVLRKFKPEQSAEKAAVIAKQALSPRQGRPGMYDVIFASLPFANILESVGNACSVFSAEAGLSCLAGKVGKRVGSEAVHLVDDGSLPNGFGTASFDDEGVPTQRNVLIEDGVLRTFLHNTSSAKRHGVKSTANAGLISPEPFNLVLKSGSFNKDEMVGQIRHGLIVTNVWYTRFQNYESGDFSTMPRDGLFEIRGGKVLGPVKELRVSDNLLHMLQGVSAVGKDSESVVSWEVEHPVVTPPVLVRGVRMSKSSE